MAKKSDANIKKENSEKKVEQILVENFVSLQKVMTNLAIKFDTLSGEISKLLELFEISAKTLAEKGYQYGGENIDKRVVEKLENVLEQNKIIAKGIALLHEKNMGERENFQPVRNVSEQGNYQGLSQRKFPEERRTQTTGV